MDYILGEYIRVGYSEGNLIVGFGSRKKTFNKKKHEILSFLSKITSPQKLDEIEAIAINEIGDYGKDVFHQLYKDNVIVPNFELEDRYSRPQLSYVLNGHDPMTFQEKLNDSKVTILGAGGIGNIISVILATSGVGKIHLVDGDIVETSNLTRQFMFEEKDVDKSKTITLREKLLARNPNVEISYRNQFMTDENIEQVIPKDSSLVVISADQSHVMCQISHYCIEHKIPYINVGYVNDISVWGPFYIPGLNGCHLCLPLAKKKCSSKRLDSLIENINCRYKAPSNAVVNTLSATFATKEIIDYLGADKVPHSSGKRLGFNNLTNDFMDLKCLKDGQCKCHKH